MTPPCADCSGERAVPPGRDPTGADAVAERPTCPRMTATFVPTNRTHPFHHSTVALPWHVAATPSGALGFGRTRVRVLWRSGRRDVDRRGKSPRIGCGAGDGFAMELEVDRRQMPQKDPNSVTTPQALRILACCVTAVLVSCCQRLGDSVSGSGPLSSSSSDSGQRGAPAREPGSSARREQPASKVSFEGCTTTSSGPNVVILQCAPLTLKIMRPETVDSAAVFGTTGKGWTQQRIDIAGTSLPGAVLTGNQDRIGVAVEVTRDAERRFVSCFVQKSAAGDEQCRSALGYLVVGGFVWDVQFEAYPLRVSGHTLFVPEGCEVTHADRIRCPDAELHWREPNPTCRQTADEARAGFEKLLRGVGNVTHTSQPCVVFGEALTCDRYVLLAPNQPPVVIVASTRGCGYPAAQCNVASLSARRFPQPCDQVFSGEP